MPSSTASTGTAASGAAPAAAAPPGRCEVLVVGAGPAGSAAAQRLASAGLEVLLVDQQAFPRDKICGDGLIPDAHAALRRLGVYDEVAAIALPVPHVRCVGPRGGFVDVPGRLSVLPRRELDHVLVRAAERAGARLHAPLRFLAPLLEGGQVVGARLKSPQGEHEVLARWVVLATGAVPAALQAAGLCERVTPTGVALRGYFRHEALAQEVRQLQVVWHPAMRGGYGWLFPGPGGVFNIGAGHTSSHRQTGGEASKRQEINLRRMLDAFCEVYAPAGRLVREGQAQGELKGAPLRCSLRGARWSRPGMLATGEAAGSTYAFSGEGIGKAMETGLLAAEAIVQQRQADEASVRARYEAALKALAPRFELYDAAGWVNEHPWLADLVVWRANRSPSILRRLTGVLEETQNPGRLFSWKGAWHLMFE